MDDVRLTTNLLTLEKREKEITKLLINECSLCLLMKHAMKKAEVDHNLQWEVITFVESYLINVLDDNGFYWKSPLPVDGIADYCPDRMWKPISRLGKIKFHLLSGNPVFQEKQDEIFSSLDDFQTIVWNYIVNMFNGTFTWEAMISTLAFAGELARLCLEESRNSLIECIAHCVYVFIISQCLTDFIKKGSWKEFRRQCHILNARFVEADFPNDVLSLFHTFNEQ